MIYITHFPTNLKQRTVALLFILCLSSCKFKDHNESLKISKSEIVKNNLISNKEKTGDSIKIIGKFGFKNPRVPIEDTLVLKNDKKVFTITPTGVFYTDKFDSLQLNTKMIVEKAVLAEDTIFYYLFFSDTDYQYTGSQLQKISKDNLKPQYSLKTGGGQLGLIKIIEDYAYVTNSGFVAKINLVSGTYNWKHEDLYDQKNESFNSFDSIIRNKDSVKFVSRNFFNKKHNQVIVDDKTGKIILISK